MKRFVRFVVGTAMAMVAIGAVTSTAAMAPPAEAVTYVSTAYTASAQGQTKIDQRCRIKGHVLCVDKTKRKLYYVESGRVVKTLDARFGCAGMRTREGKFTVRAKSRHHVSTIYHTPMPYAMFFSGGQAVHYSADFAARGYAGCSHGCVNIRNRSTIAWIFNRMHVGDRVVVYRS